MTIVIPLQGARVLLGMKTRGFGAGWYNNFGGKPLPGETIEQATARELKEKCGADITLDRLLLAANIDFRFPDKPE